MSIFGTSHPKIIVNIDTTLDEVLLQYAVVLKDEPELDSYEVRAVRTGKRVFTNAGKHWIFQVKIHLWKYADPIAKYLELKSYEGTEVLLYRHSDGDPIYDTYWNEGRFFIQSVNESITDEKNKYDVLTLTFRSIDFIGIPLYDFSLCEHFSGNSYDSEFWELTNLVSGSSITGEQYVGSHGVSALHSSLENENGKLWNFKTKLISSITSDFEVTASIWKSGTSASCTRSVFLGLWASENYFAGIIVDSIYHNGKVYVLTADNGGRGVFNNAVEVVGLTPNIKTNYKITYNRTDNLLKFYYKDGSTWILITSITIADFDTRKYYAGIFMGIFNSNAIYPCYGDDLCVKYTPDGW